MFTLTGRDSVNRWLGSRRRWLIWYGVFMLPQGVFAWIFFVTGYGQQFLLWAAILMVSWLAVGVGVAYYVGPILRRRHPNPAEFL